MSYGHHHCQDRCESVSSQGNFPVEAVRGIFLVSNLPVGDDDMQRGVLSSVHGLRIRTSLQQQLRGGGTGELTHLVSVEII